MSKAKAQELPGMENRELKDLQEAALEYAEIRDKRQSLTGQEVELKARVLALMHQYKKETYSYQGVEINIIHEEETVKVRVSKKNAEEEEAA